MLKAFEYFNEMQKNDILLAFRGEITSELLDSVWALMDKTIPETPEQFRWKKKVNNILVECLQNIYHHTDSVSVIEEKENDSFIAVSTGNALQIVTGNFIFNKNIPDLKQKIDEVNAIPQTAISDHYREALKNSKHSDKGGAGLGMIDMVRKSGNMIAYNFDSVSSEKSFFSLHITINK